MIKESKEPSADAPFHDSFPLKVILHYQPTPVKDMDMSGSMIPYPRYKDEVASTYLSHSIISDTPCHDASKGVAGGEIREM